MESCTVNLFGRVEFGHIFQISGVPAAGCKNFKIVFSDGGVNIPLIIFVNMRLREVVLNSFLNDDWGESLKVDVNLLDPSRPFKFYVFVNELKFHIALNGKHLEDFVHLTTVDNIRSIRVSGDLEQITQIDHRRAYPTAWPPIHEDFNTVAFSSDIPYEYSPGSLILLKMRLTGSSKGSFFIRFNDRATRKQMFHFNPRFAEKVIVVNSMNDSLEWLKDEKRSIDFPFKLDTVFYLAIAMTSSSFKVAIDGRHLLTYDFKTLPGLLQSAFANHHPIFDRLTGFKIFALNGMKLFVSQVDHIELKEECEFYESFSDPKEQKQNWSQHEHKEFIE